MGCGNEISDWDDKAVQDSLAGKNTELTPELKAEAEECRAAREFLQEKTSGFEKSDVVHNRDMVRAIAYVPLAREIAQDLGIHNITFKEDLGGERGLSGLDDKGAKIFIAPAGNTNKEEYQYTLYHEMGELYFLHRLSFENQHEWKTMCEEADPKNLNDVERNQELDKWGRDIRSQHHFTERFTEYCLATQEMQKHGDSSWMNDLRQKFPEQMEALDKLIGK